MLHLVPIFNITAISCDFFLTQTNAHVSIPSGVCPDYSILLHTFAQIYSSLAIYKIGQFNIGDLLYLLLRLKPSQIDFDRTMKSYER